MLQHLENEEKTEHDHQGNLLSQELKYFPNWRSYQASVQRKKLKTPSKASLYLKKTLFNKKGIAEHGTTVVTCRLGQGGKKFNTDITHRLNKPNFLIPIQIKSKMYWLNVFSSRGCLFYYPCGKTNANSDKPLTVLE